MKGQVPGNQDLQRGVLLPEHNTVVFDEHMDIGAVLNTKLHEHVLGPVVPQRPGMLPAEELRWGFIGVGEGRLRAFGKGGRKGKFRDVLCYGPVIVELNET